MKRLLIFLMLATLYGCKQNFLKNTKWRIIEVKADSISNLTEMEKKAMKMLAPPTELYQTFSDTIVLTQVVGREADTSNYKLKGDQIIFYRPNIDTNIGKILYHSKDTIRMRSDNGILATLIRIK